MAYEYGVNLKLDSEKALKDIDTLLGKLREMETAAGKIKLKVSATNDIDKQQRDFLKSIQQMRSAEQRLNTQRQVDEERVRQAKDRTTSQQIRNAEKEQQAYERTQTARIKSEQEAQRAQDTTASKRVQNLERENQARSRSLTAQMTGAERVRQAEEKTASLQIQNTNKELASKSRLLTTQVTGEERIRQAKNKTASLQKQNLEREQQQTIKTRQAQETSEEKVRQQKQKTAQETIKTAQQEEKAAQAVLKTRQQEVNLMSKLLRLQNQVSAQQKQSSTITKIGNGLTAVGGAFTGLGELGYRVTNSLNAVQSTAAQFVNSMFNYAQQVGNQILSQVENIASASLEQYEALETAEIGFANFFEGDPKEFVETLKQHAEDMPGVGAQDLIQGIQYVAPQAKGNSELALAGAEGVMKAILYSGNSPSQYGSNALMNIQQLASGAFTYQDIKQMIRAMPTITRLLAETDRGKELLDNGAITTDKMKAYVKKYGESALLELFAEIGKDSSAADIYDKYANTFAGVREKLQETVKNRWNKAMDDNGVYNSIKEWIDKISNNGLIDNTFNHIGKVVGDFFTFLQRNEKPLTEWVNVAKDVLKDIGNTFKEVATDLAKDLGLLNDDGSINVEGLKELTRKIGDFIKGVIKGFGSGLKQLGNIIQWVVDRLGTDGWQQLGQILGWIASPLGKVIVLLGTLFSSLMQMLGNTMTVFGGSAKTGLISRLFGGKGKASAASAASAAGVTSSTFLIPDVSTDTSFMGKVKNVAGKTMSGIKTFAGKAFKSAAIFAVGEAVNSFASELVGQVSGDSNVAQVARDLGDVVVSGIAVGSQFGLVAGAAAGVVTALKKVSDVVEDIKQTAKDYAETVKELSVTTKARNYLDTVVDNLKDMGLYEEFEDRSEDAYEEMLSQANSIAANTKDPQEAIRKLMDVYLHQYGRDTVAKGLNQYAQEDKGGATQINPKDEETRQMLISIYNNLVNMGLIEGNGDGWAENATGQEVWNYLSKNGVTINSKEFLTGLSEQLNTAAGDFNELINKGKETDIKLTLDNGEETYDTIDEYMQAGGFIKDGDAWKMKLEVEVEANVNKSTSQILHDAGSEAQKAGDVGGAIGNYFLEGLNRAIGTGNPLLPWAEGGWFNWDLWKSYGGVVKPIYRADGGDIPSRGVDTVPTMLSPGEYVMKSSAVSKAGLGIMNAINRGDLGAAARSIGARFTNSWNNSRSYSRTANNNQRYITNNVAVYNRSRAGSLNSYFSFANRLASSY